MAVVVRGRLLITAASLVGQVAERSDHQPGAEMVELGSPGRDMQVAPTTLVRHGDQRAVGAVPAALEALEAQR